MTHEQSIIEILKVYGMKAEDLYMNTDTGSVDTAQNWVSDYLSSEEYENDMLFDEWNADSLAHVIKDENGDWVESTI